MRCAPPERQVTVDPAMSAIGRRDLAGSLAPEIQFVQVCSAAVVAGSGETENSKRLIKFLASPLASEAIRNSRMEPLATSH
jgi:ABC-type molybdate transport system substrate-binding protein